MRVGLSDPHAGERAEQDGRAQLIGHRVAQRPHLLHRGHLRRCFACGGDVDLTDTTAGTNPADIPPVIVEPASAVLPNNMQRAIDDPVRARGFDSPRRFRVRDLVGHHAMTDEPGR